MNSSSAKAALVPLVLAATWATAQANDYRVTVTPNAGVTLGDVHVYSAVTTTTGADETFSPTSNPGTTTQGEMSLASLGSVSGGSTVSTVVSTSYGTSTDFSTNGSQASFGLLATSGDLAVLGAAASTGSYAGSFGSTGKTLDQAIAGTRAGDLGLASALYPVNSSNTLFGSNTAGMTTTGSFYRFDASGNASLAGTWSVSTQTVQATPEPASMAALGAGALALLRRRRKLA